MMRPLMFLGLAVLAGGLMAVQFVLNTALGQRAGTLGAVLILTAISLMIVVSLVLIFPSSADYLKLPAATEWYLYLGAVFGIIVLIAPILLIPRIGTASTLVGIVFGQVGCALLIDHWGFLGSPKIELSVARVLGILLIASGVVLVNRH